MSQGKSSTGGSTDGVRGSSNEQAKTFKPKVCKHVNMLLGDCILILAIPNHSV